MEASIKLVPIEILHDGRTDESGVDAALDKITGDAQGSLRGPDRGVDAPFELRIDSVARGDATRIRGAELLVAPESIVMKAEQTVLEIMIARRDDRVSILFQQRFQ